MNGQSAACCLFLEMPSRPALVLPFVLLVVSALAPVCTGNAETDASEKEHQRRLGAFFLALLLGIACLAGYALRVRHITWFPEAGLSLLIGVIAGAILHSFAGTEHSRFDEIVAFMKFDKDTFFLFLLPPIIFESAYNLNSRKFFANIDAVLMLSIYGTLAATILTGVLVKVVGSAGWCHPFSWLPSMVFGSLISATDPVTVLALFSELNADINLYNHPLASQPLCPYVCCSYSMVYGESVLNDAVALVMFVKRLPHCIFVTFCAGTTRF